MEQYKDKTINKNYYGKSPVAEAIDAYKTSGYLLSINEVNNNSYNSFIEHTQKQLYSVMKIPARYFGSEQNEDEVIILKQKKRKTFKPIILNENGDEENLYWKPKEGETFRISPQPNISHLNSFIVGSDVASIGNTDSGSIFISNDNGTIQSMKIGSYGGDVSNKITLMGDDVIQPFQGIKINNKVRLNQDKLIILNNN